ncbi:MAG: methyltransferase domain-containing protein [Roseimicrobium sp.]
MNMYETPRLLAEYLLFHYGADQEVLPWEFGPREALHFAERSVTHLLEPASLAANTRSLDLGCAVGRSCYELARHSVEVLGIDYSQSFVSAAEAIRREGALAYPRLDEGPSQTLLVATRPSEGEHGRIRFEQGDALNLRADIGCFDFVHAANLLCRLAEPQRLLERLPELVNPGGQLLLTTPCTWLEEFTPTEHWPQGSTFEWLKEKLYPHFMLAHREDLPFLIREHARKFQWSVALGTRWVRR